MPRESLWSRVLRHSKKSGDLYVYAWTVDGKTVISASSSTPFPPNQPEAKRVMGSKPRGPATLADIEQIHRLAALVRQSYGDEAVGNLPALPAEPQTEKVA